MPPASKLCPFCRGLNSASETRCYRCGRPLPGPLASGLLGSLRGVFSGDAPMTKLLLGLCVTVFALSIASDRRLPIIDTSRGSLGMASFTLSTMLRFGFLWRDLVRFEPWRYLAAVFVHFNLLHLAMNCWSLIAIGPGAERHFGRARYLTLYVLSGVLGFVASQWWYGAGSQTAGASGAIFGALASVVGVAYARRDPNWKALLVQNGVNMAIIALMFPANNVAHLGGAIAGALLGFAFSKEPRKLKLDVPFGILAVLLVLASIGSVVLSTTSPIWRAVREQEQNRRDF